MKVEKNQKYSNLFSWAFELFVGLIVIRKNPIYDHNNVFIVESLGLNVYLLDYAGKQ